MCNIYGEKFLFQENSQMCNRKKHKIQYDGCNIHIQENILEKLYKANNCIENQHKKLIIFKAVLALN